MTAPVKELLRAKRDGRALTADELRSGKPIIGIAQTGSDLSPCNRHHLVLAERVREGVRDVHQGLQALTR